MKEKTLLSIALGFIGVAIIVSSFIISTSLNKMSHSITQSLSQSQSNTFHAVSQISGELQQIRSANDAKNNPSMTINEAAEYLKLTTNQLEYIIEHGGSDIPYLKVSNTFVFNKEALDQWMMNGQNEYIIGQ